jgi:hypothetical protein
MIFLEEYARWLLVLHTTTAVALVASSTHLVVWMRGYMREKCSRHRSVRKFAYITLAMFVLAFALGNLVYPTYKARVRMEYLENPTAVAADSAARAQVAAQVRERYERAKALREGVPVERVEAIGIAPSAPDPSFPRETAKIARWFDVKEHWVALGLMLSAACALIVTFWDPGKTGAEIAPVVFGLAIGACATTWLGAIIGVLTASYRAVGG